MTGVKDRKRNVLRKTIICLLIIAGLGSLIYTAIKLYNTIPDTINLTINEDEEFNFDLPVEGEIQSATGVININNESVPANQIKLDLRDPFTLKATEYGNYKINLKIFGLIDFKQVSVDVIENVELVPAGNTIGIYIESDGILVLGTGVIKGEDGLNYEPALNMLHTGDYITSVNDKKVECKEDLMDAIATSKGESLKLEVRRNNEYLFYDIKPVKSSSNEYKLGIWVRDDTQGIGTMTFTTKDGGFGALGHGITDVDTSQIVEVKQGSIYNADVTSIVKGTKGDPGELIGVINQEKDNTIGNITKNTSQGVYGKVNGNYSSYNKPLPVGLKQEVKEGPASILTCVSNEIEEYDIIIEDISLGGANSSKGIVLEIVDQDLLDKTGGIVQGMSGSPIIQDGKIIGAVTHVFIQDSTKGYGTFIENMIFNIDS